MSKVMRCSRYGNGDRMHVILNGVLLDSGSGSQPVDRDPQGGREAISGGSQSFQFLRT